MIRLGKTAQEPITNSKNQKQNKTKQNQSAILLIECQHIYNLNNEKRKTMWLCDFYVVTHWFTWIVHHFPFIIYRIGIEIILFHPLFVCIVWKCLSFLLIFLLFASFDVIKIESNYQWKIDDEINLMPRVACEHFFCVLKITLQMYAKLGFYVNIVSKVFISDENLLRATKQSYRKGEWDKWMKKQKQAAHVLNQNLNATDWKHINIILSMRNS